MGNTIENIYEAYCPMLYNIALQACSTHSNTKKILKLSFEKVYRQEIEWLDKKPFCLNLVELIIQTAREELYTAESKCNFKITAFENTPVLHKLFVEQVTLENYCLENDFIRDKAMAIIRNEFMLISITYSDKTVNAGINVFHLN